MARKRRDDIFIWQKSEALYGLIRALEDGRIPDTTHECPLSERYLTSGNIIALLEDEFLRLPKDAMLQALRDIKAHHCSHNRFIAVDLHDYINDMYLKYREYIESLPEELVTRSVRVSPGSNYEVNYKPNYKPILPDPAEEPEDPSEEPS